MKTDNLSEIRARLWASAEMAHVRVQFLFWAAGFGLCLLLCGAGENWRLTFPTLAVCLSVTFLPVLIFWLVRTWRIFRKAEHYVFCPAELSQPHHAPYGRGLFSFMGVIETERDGRFAVETHAIFQASGIGLVMEDYLGKTVTLAWNRETDMVVVIG